VDKVNQSFAKWYDFFMFPLEQGKFKNIRMDLLNRSKGKVIEIGSGSGINFPLYKKVESVTAIEPSPYMIERSNKNKQAASVPINIIQSGAEKLPFSDDTFDTVVATLVFCTIRDTEKALKEIKRVCKPNGKILLFEHIKMDNQFLARLQQQLTPYWSKICDGCQLDRDTVHIFAANGFDIVELKKYYNGLFVTMELHSK
jgi:ubiquinone/menaquinone biosynthesis C-methylase UbiE